MLRQGVPGVPSRHCAVFRYPGLHPRHCEACKALCGARPKQSFIPVISYVLLMEYGGVVYILTNHTHTVLYVGVTSKIESRLIEHREKFYAQSFTAKYNVSKLVYYQAFSSIEEAIAEEKRIKGGSRAKKIRLIISMNPDWKDLSEELT